MADGGLLPTQMTRLIGLIIFLRNRLDLADHMITGLGYPTLVLWASTTLKSLLEQDLAQIRLDLGVVIYI